jgi:serine protease AprX
MPDFILIPRDLLDATLDLDHRSLEAAANEPARLRLTLGASDAAAQKVVSRLEGLGLRLAGAGATPGRPAQPYGETEVSVEPKFRGPGGAKSPKKGLTKAPAQRLLPPVDDGAGRVSPLFRLGATVASFATTKAADDARTDLDREYVFVPDVIKFSLPPPIRLDTGPSVGHQPVREWPDASGIQKAHQAAVRGAGVLVGILDTGVDADHAEHTHHNVNHRYVSLFPNSASSPPRDVRGFDTDGHGTHVSGIVAGRSVGVAPEADLYVASVIESETIQTSLTRVLTGLEWILAQFSRPENATRPAVLNMSLGFPSETPADIDAAAYDANIKAIRLALRQLVRSNVLPVVAAGNSGTGTWGYPAGFPEVLAVGAVDFDGQVTSFSSSGVTPDTARTVPDLCGYGSQVYSSVERRWDGQSVYRRMSGTSMACPYVTGIAALYRCRTPRASVKEIRDLILDKVSKLPGASAARAGKGLAVFA